MKTDKTDIWFPFYIGDYIKDTRHLSLDEHGAYLLILMELYNKGGSIPEKNIERLVGNPSKWNDIWLNIKQFFQIVDGVITQKKVTKEINRKIHLKEIGSKGGKKSGGNPNFKSGEINPYYAKDKAEIEAKDKAEDKPKDKPPQSQSQSQSQLKSKAQSINNSVAFSKPTVSEIKDFCLERDNQVDAEYFWNYYESNGWHVGKKKMVKWKACVITWEKNNFQSQNNSQSQYVNLSEIINGK